MHKDIANVVIEYIAKDGWFILGVAFIIWTLLMQIPTEIPA